MVLSRSTARPLNGTGRCKDVVSGVPQGSVLGPLLFVIFINDLDLGISNTVLKFADDTKVLGLVMNDNDRVILQSDLNTVCNWADKSQMEFNIPKCKVMHFGFRNSHYDYSMKGQQLEAVSSERDIGVIIASNLKVADHCQHAYSMANRMLGLVSRSIKHRDVGIMVRLYKSLVRPHLEYSTPDSIQYIHPDDSHI